MTVPQNFLIRDGQVYEMEGMSVGYMPIRKFITEGYRNSTNVYRQFAVPRPIPAVLLPLKYALNESNRFYGNSLKKPVMQWLKDTNVYSYFPEIAKFFQRDHVTQGPYFYAMSIPLIVVALILAFNTLRLLYAILTVCCCSQKSRTAQVKVHRKQD